MSKKCVFGLFTVLSISAQLSFAQNLKDTTIQGLRSFCKLKVGDYNGFEWEQKVGKKSMVDLFGGAGIGVNSDGFSFSNRPNSKLVITPELYSEYRNYYNLSSRLRKKKTDHNNSGNFLFGRLSIILPVEFHHVVVGFPRPLQAALERSGTQLEGGGAGRSDTLFLYC